MINFENKKILVTGSGGLIGSHLAEELYRRGANVRALVKYNSRNDKGCLKFSPFLNNIEVVRGDICSIDSVKEAMNGVDIVFNLAALPGIPYSYIHPLEVVTTNTIGTLNILMVGRDNNIEKIIQTSTSETYGSAQYVPIDEKHPIHAQSPYAASKVAADSIAMSFYYSFNTQVVIARPFNVYGPRQTGRAVLINIIKQALRDKKIIIGNTTTSRDFNYVTDTVNGFIHCSAMVGDTYNIGSGVETTINDAILTIKNIIGSSVDICVDKSRIRPAKSEVSRLQANSKKLYAATGWKPEIDIKKGLKNTIKWVEDNMDYYIQEESYAI